MENVHFLNLEYLLLRVYEVTHPVVEGASEAAGAPASSALQTLAPVLGSIALIGMAATFVLFILMIWVRIRLIVVEHHGFEEKEQEHHVAHPAGVAATSHVEPKNPRWERVRELAAGSSESDWRLAILEADIMLNDLLKEQGYRGEGIGERLRDGNPLQFTTLDLAWQAHKVRNDIAHAGADFKLSQRDADATIDLYRRVFEEFKFI